jgi:parallel beta-helix repeat protein
MRAAHKIVVGLTGLLFPVVGIVGVLVEDAGASVTPPATVNELVSLNGSPSDAGCPTGITPTVGSYTSLPAAITAASSNNTIYVCNGTYNLGLTATYSANEDVVVNKSLTIDASAWNSPPSGSDTDQSVDPTTQAVFENGAGFLVETGHVTIKGLTFEQNNFNNATPDCFAGTLSLACSSSIDVQSFQNNTGAGDQGESNVTIDNNLFVDTGGFNYQNGDIHFGLGQDGSATDVTALDSGDVVEDNVIYSGVGYQNNAIQISDTSGAIVDSNTVTYPTNVNGNDDDQISALWFPGFDQATQVESNTLNGGGLQDDVNSGINLADPKSGIKFVDTDATQTYGDGCTGQEISDNTISGFVHDISMQSMGTDTDNHVLCGSGPSHFTISDNQLSDARLDGIYVTGSTNSTISGNDTTTTDTEGYNGTLTAGQYDYEDDESGSITNTWSNNLGTGSAFPSSISDTNPTPTTVPPTTVPPTTVTPTAVTPTTVTPTTVTPTTLAPVPVVSTSAIKLKAGSTVSTTVHCTNATCVGTLELTKTVTTRVRIPHTERYRVRTTVVDLGRTRYAVMAGASRGFNVHLNSKGLKLLHSATGRRYSCELVTTSSSGTTRKMISFARP